MLTTLRSLMLMLVVFCAGFRSRFMPPRKRIHLVCCRQCRRRATGSTLSPGLVLMGGGTDVDAAFQWMCSAQAAATSL